jgi:YHS domain-containing protein
MNFIHNVEDRMIQLTKAKMPLAVDPITGVEFTVTAARPSIVYFGGQRLFFATQTSKASFLHDGAKKSFLNIPGKPELKRQPDQYGLSVKCVVLAQAQKQQLQLELESDASENQMAAAMSVSIPVNNMTPRVQVSGGQELYFGTIDAVIAFAADPMKYMVSDTDTATTRTCVCPLNQIEIDIVAGTTFATVTLTHGQELYFATKQCAEKFLENPANYFMPAEKFVADMDTMLLPKLCGLLMHDVVNNHALVCNKTTPRVWMKGGQQVNYQMDT